jgi:isoaspartyl peptidase/L-asparaginase-like protein (Ntn-hydrolase superfamily)
MCYELLRRAVDGAGLQVHADALCREVRAATGSPVGVIAVRPDGEVAVAHASRHMSFAIARADAEHEIEFGLAHAPTRR